MDIRKSRFLGKRSMALCKWIMDNLVLHPVRIFFVVILFASLVVVIVSLFWEALSSILFPNTVVGVYKKDFWENLLGNLHGSIIELGFFGFIILWADYRRGKIQEIKKHKENLTDYAFIDLDFINYKKANSIKSLNELGVFDISVQNLYLNNIVLKEAVFEKTKLIGFKCERSTVSKSAFREVKMRSSKFTGSKISNTAYEKCDLYKSKFDSSVCKGVSFKNSVLDRCDFSNADLQNAIFVGADLRGVNFEGANLKQSSFKDTNNLDVTVLAKAKCLDYIKIDPEKLQELLKIRPEIIYQVGRP